jgi:hypothetical protein
MDAAFWNNRYTAPQYLYLYDETPNAFVTEMAPPIPAGPVLCLAEGDGRKVAISFVLGVFFDAKARHEERWLRQQFPAYAGYERRVRRFIPWIY